MTSYMQYDKSSKTNEWNKREALEYLKTLCWKEFLPKFKSRRDNGIRMTWQEKFWKTN